METFTLLVILFLSFTSAFAWPVVLDVSSDSTDIMWKIKGNPKSPIYLPDGPALRGIPVRQYLPEEFLFDNFAKSKGIWAVVPQKNDCELFEDTFNLFSSEEESDRNSSIHSTTTKPTSQCNVTASASFQFSTAAQLMASVKVTYNFGGNATIRIIGARGHPYEESANGKDFDNWIETSIPLDGRQMIVEAIVNQNGDYVLIDKIIVEISEASTTPRTRRPTTNITTTTTAEPASGQQKLTTRLETILTVFLVLVYKMLI